MGVITTTTSGNVTVEKYSPAFADYTKPFSFYVSKTFGCAEFTLLVEEAINISDTVTKRMDVIKRENFTITSEVHKKMELLAKEAIHFDEIHKKIVDFNINIRESIAVYECPAKVFALNKREYLSIGNKKATLNTVKAINERISFTENYSRKSIINRTFIEKLGIAELPAKVMAKRLTDGINITDASTKGVGKLVKEAVCVNENEKHIFNSVRTFSERIAISDKPLKTIEKSINESLKLHDSLIRAIDGVLSHIVMNEKFITLADFNSIIDKPGGYTSFAEFKVGEYEYKDALVRIKFNAKTQQTMPSATNVVMHVDIPDTDDRGTVVITDTSAPTKVYFNKFYYNPPEVAVTLRGATTGQGIIEPNIVSTTYSDDGGRYFEVELLGENGQRTTGSISWMAKGY